MVRNYKRKTEARWSKDDLLEALLCIHEGHLKINDAAKHFGISRATLHRQYRTFINGGAKCDANQFRTCGGNPILTKMEEDVFETTIKDLQEQGCTLEAGDIKRICFEYCDTNGIPNQFDQEKRMASAEWYYGFLKRHPGVKISRPYKKKVKSGEASSSGSGTSAPASVTPSDKAGEVTALKEGTIVINTAPVKVSRAPDKPKQPAAIILAASPEKKSKKRSSSSEATQPGTNSKRAKKGDVEEEGLESQGRRDDQSESGKSDESKEEDQEKSRSDSGDEGEESGEDSDSPEGGSEEE